MIEYLDLLITNWVDGNEYTLDKWREYPAIGGIQNSLRNGRSPKYMHALMKLVCEYLKTSIHHVNVLQNYIDEKEMELSATSPFIIVLLVELITLLLWSEFSFP